jgi:hypothetical protein
MPRNVTVEKMTEAAYIIALQLREMNKHSVQTGQTLSNEQLTKLARMLTRALKLSSRLAKRVQSQEQSRENSPKLPN